MYKIRRSNYEGQGLREISVNLDWQKDIQKIESDRGISKQKEEHWKI